MRLVAAIRVARAEKGSCLTALDVILRVLEFRKSWRYHRCSRASDCSGHGDCSADGTACECDSGYFGAACASTCNCTAAGTARCDDGVGGSGECICRPGWTGAACDTKIVSKKTLQRRAAMYRKLEFHPNHCAVWISIIYSKCVFARQDPLLYSRERLG